VAEIQSQVPSSNYICDGADLISQETKKDDPDHALISIQLVLLSEAQSDINTMFRECESTLKGDMKELDELLQEADRSIGKLFGF
jgi:hypothetical protein